MSAADEKQQLRRRVLAARDGLPAAERERLSAAVCARAAALPELEAARTILFFASFGSEVDTGLAVLWALQRGKRVCLPRILGPRRMAAFLVTDLADDLQPGMWDIPEPREGLPEVPPREIDAVIVPGSLFDEQGGRCGYGGGFYDSYLPGTRPGTPRIGMALELQMVEEVPRERHDLGVDVVVTESRVIRPGRARCSRPGPGPAFGPRP
jgi:5-formyltetrahydrofolate cyclo-ligase